MSKRVALRRALGLAVVLGGMFGEAGVVRAQPERPIPCSGRAPIQCPTPTSFRTWVFNNLKPDGAGVCRLEERNIAPLQLFPGENVDWTFCNACSVDMEVQLDTASSGPFERFSFFFPMPLGDNQVKTVVPCQGYGGISGRGAEAGEPHSWKYSIRARPASSPGDFPDVIDPDLVIDDTPGFHRHLKQWGIPIGLLLLGLLLGWLFARRRR